MSGEGERWRTTVVKFGDFAESWLVPLAGAVLFTVANVCVKLSLGKDRQWLMFVAFGGSVAAYWLFRRVCILKGLALTEGVFGSLITVLTVVVGLLIFKESLNPKQMAGLGLILVGLFLIQ
jgi:multidrug transporter EmrE-like cation transporter